MTASLSESFETVAPTAGGHAAGSGVQPQIGPAHKLGRRASVRIQVLDGREAGAGLPLPASAAAALAAYPDGDGSGQRRDLDPHPRRTHDAAGRRSGQRIPRRSLSACWSPARFPIARSAPPAAFCSADVMAYKAEEQCRPTQGALEELRRHRPRNSTWAIDRGEFFTAIYDACVLYPASAARSPDASGANGPFSRQMDDAIH